MFNKDLISEYKNKKMPDDLKSGILETMREQKAPAKPRFAVKRRVLAYAAVFMSLILVVSAAAVIYNNTQPQYIPFKGFVENDGSYEVYYTPEVLSLGDARIETVTRTKAGDSHELSIIMTNLPDGNLKIITENHGEFDITPSVMYGDYNYAYYIQNFPDINKFVLSCGGYSTEVKLEPSNPDDVIIAEDSNATLKFYHMSKGSKFAAYDIDERNFDTEKILGAAYDKRILLGAVKMYDADGNVSEDTGWRGNVEMSGKNSVIFMDFMPNDELWKLTEARKLITDNMSVHINILDVCADEYIPVPADGEEIIFDGGLVIYERNGLVVTAKSVSRRGNKLNVWTDAQYTGAGSENIRDIQVNWYYDSTVNGGGHADGGTINKFDIANGTEQVLMKIWSIDYDVNGSWEVNLK